MHMFRKIIIIDAMMKLDDDNKIIPAEWRIANGHVAEEYTTYIVHKIL